LTEHRIRKTMADIFSRANREKMPSGTVREFLAAWLQAKQLEVSESSLPEYDRAVKTLVDSLGSKADRPVDAITRKDALTYRAHLAQRVGPASVNKMLRILRGAWRQAGDSALTIDNVFPSSIELKEKSAARRRALTMPELKKVMEVCDDEWRGMVLLGLYTGQRLGDLAGLTWGNVDIEKGVVAFMTKKTDRPMEIPWLPHSYTTWWADPPPTRPTPRFCQASMPRLRAAAPAPCPASSQRYWHGPG
jgi:integrase